jgi:hypothetical protein
MTTGGGLLFTGKETGEFIALDLDTSRSGSSRPGPASRPADHRHHNGKQYVASCPASVGYGGTARGSSSDKSARRLSLTFAVID